MEFVFEFSVLESAQTILMLPIILCKYEVTNQKKIHRNLEFNQQILFHYFQISDYKAITILILFHITLQQVTRRYLTYTLSNDTAGKLT